MAWFTIRSVQEAPGDDLSATATRCATCSSWTTSSTPTRRRWRASTWPQAASTTSAAARENTFSLRELVAELQALNGRPPRGGLLATGAPATSASSSATSRGPAASWAGSRGSVVARGVKRAAPVGVGEPGIPAPVRAALLSRAVFPLHDPGGMERSVYHLAKHLQGRGVETVALHPSGHGARELSGGGRDRSLRAIPRGRARTRARPHLELPGLRLPPGRRGGGPGARRARSTSSTPRACPGSATRASPERPLPARPPDPEPPGHGRAQDARPEAAGPLPRPLPFPGDGAPFRPRDRHRRGHEGRGAALPGRRSGAGGGPAQRSRPRGDRRSDPGGSRPCSSRSGSLPWATPRRCSSRWVASSTTRVSATCWRPSSASIKRRVSRPDGRGW